eukprot:scaffold16414_cov92-Skeletonema_dohrnii-CCMP3373.AAC.5
MEAQYLIIRNSKNAQNNANCNETFNVVRDDLSTSTLNDKAASLQDLPDASLSIVRLVESPEGKYMLDFGLENDPLVKSFLNNHTDQKGGLDSIFIEAQSLQHLQVYAELTGIDDLPISDELEVVQPSSLHHFQHYNNSFHLLSDSVQEVLHTLLPLEKLFSWSTLTSAKESGLLHWKDIRGILADVKRSVPFIAPTSDGLLHHIIQTHLTFHQFVTFAKLVADRLQRLPIVKMKVYQASTLSVDVRLTSNQKSTVCIGCLPSAQLSNLPSAQKLKDCDEDVFVSWECVQLVAGESTIVRLGGLKEGTVYDTYIHVSRSGSEFPVESTDADVMNSRFNIETQGYHLIDIFPVFDSMTMEEQRVELLASTKDKSVRLRAQTDGLVIPGVDEEQNDYDNETWRLYIEWWKDNLGIRYDFCMRELIFASKDQEVRRYARKDGIVMRHGISKDQAKREQWARAFCSWYHTREHEETVDGSFQISAEAVQGHATNPPPPVQTLDLPSIEVDECNIGSLRPRFQSKMSKAEVMIDEVHDDSLGGALVLQSITFPHPKASPSTPPKEYTELSPTTRNESAPVPVATSEPNSPEPMPPYADAGHDEIEVQPHAQLTSDTLKGELPMPPKPSKSSRLTIGVVGKEVSFRHRFLRRLSTRIDTCLALTRPKTASSLRGIALFRAKVRLVMLLQKVSNKPFSSLNDVDIFSYQERDTRSAKSAAATPMTMSEKDGEEEEEDDDDDDSILMDKARDHCEDRLTRNIFRMMRTWAQEVVAEKRAQEEAAEKKRAQEVAAAEKRAREEKTLAAVEVFHSLLLRKSFGSFVEALKAVKSAEESLEEDIIEDADTIEETAPEPLKAKGMEVEYMCADDDDSCKFASHWKTGKDTPFCRINRSSGVGMLIDPALLKHSINRSRIKPLDDETLSSMRRAKPAGASNLYDVPDSLLCFVVTEERPMNCFRNREIIRGHSLYV